MTIISRISPLSIIVFLLASVCLPTQAQTSAHPDSVSPLKANPYLKHNEPWRWDIKSQLFLRAGIVSYRNGQYRADYNGSWDINEIELIYPLARSGGHYWSPNTEIQSSLRIDDTIYELNPQTLYTPDTKVPYVWWESQVRPDADDRIELIHAIQVSHVVSADTVFDEQRAKEIPWPEQWPTEAERFLTPLIDPIDEPIDLIGQDRLTMMVNRWLEGNDPKSIDSVTLAKYMTGKVLDYVRNTRSGLIYSPTLHYNYNNSEQAVVNGEVVGGFATFPRSSWSGFVVRSADQIAIKPAGSEYDQSIFLASVLRTVGLPARTLICYDTREYRQSEERIRVFVEFALYDEQRDQVLWIPIDTQRLRDNGRRSSSYEQRWDYFGTHDELHFYAPLAYYFHPTVNYSAYGLPALYGFRTPTDLGNSVAQILSLDVINSPLRADELNRP
jgi:hypothetical protein